MCADYVHKWRFNFGIKKTKCMTIGYQKLYVVSLLNTNGNYRRNHILENVSSVYILGVAFNNNSTPVNDRIQK